jgi:hypothetical protein
MSLFLLIFRFPIFDSTHQLFHSDRTITEFFEIICV